MSFSPRRPRFGRLIDFLVVLLLLVAFLGLAAYHYSRLDRFAADPDRTARLAAKNFGARPAAGTDWPQWRGPNRDGISTENILTDWPQDGPKKLWEQKTGEGFSSVAVVKGRLFTIFQDGANETVVCWDAETGKEYWRHSYDRFYENSYGNGPRSTPSVDGDFVYTVGGTGMMHCLKVSTGNPKGEVVWSKDLMKDFGAKPPTWGVSFSPLIEGDRIFIMPGGKAGNSIAALDKRTGALLWKKLDDLAGYSSPIAATIHNERQVLFFTGDRLVSVRPDNGELLWEFPWVLQQQTNIATPIVEENYVFISSGYGKGCAMLEIDKQGAVWSAIAVYENNRMRNHFSTCVRHGNFVYGFDDTILVCMDIRTGKVHWKERGFDKGSVLLVKDHLIVYGANGQLALAEANSKEFAEKARFQFSPQRRSCWSVPVVSDGRLYVRDLEKLVCYDVKAK
jgi:outer membrane protein assembly factor BamB